MIFIGGIILIKLILIRIASWILSLILIAIFAILRTDADTKKEAEKIRKVHGEKIVRQTNTFIIIFIPELIIFLMLLGDIRLTFSKNNK